MKVASSLLQYRKQIISVIEKYVPGSKVYLFGSRARGTNYEGSDIDIALDAGKKIDRLLIGNILEEMEASSIPFFVDIVDMHGASDAIVEQIKREGILWNS